MQVRLLLDRTQVDLRRRDVAVPECYSDCLNVYTRLGQTACKKHSKGVRWLLGTLHLEAFRISTLDDGDDDAVFKVAVDAALGRWE
jgi:hypothetical protein